MMFVEGEIDGLRQSFKFGERRSQKAGHSE